MKPECYPITTQLGVRNIVNLFNPFITRFAWCENKASLCIPDAPLIYPLMVFSKTSLPLNIIAQ